MMTDCERTICNEWLEFICATQDVGVDLFVYLRTDPEIALERIRKRSRREEADIPLEYLQALHVLHDDWLRGTSQFKLHAPVVELDANKSAEEVRIDFKGYVMEHMSQMCYLVEDEVLR